MPATMCSLEKRNNLFILTLTGANAADQRRLNPAAISSLLSALSLVKSQATTGSVLITTVAPDSKFFSNGFDLDWAQKAAANCSNPAVAAIERLQYMVDSFKPVVAALISLPMPTIAAVCGHAAAAGLMLALSHDYVLVTSDKGVLYMPEVDLGLPLPDYFSAMLAAKISSASARRDLLLRGEKVRGEQAVKMGLVDATHAGEKVREASVRLGEQLASKKWKGEVYAEIRKSLYPQLCQILGLQSKSMASLTPRL